jgi:hypothetical protein
MFRFAFKAFALLDRVGQLTEGVTYFKSASSLKALHISSPLMYNSKRSAYRKSGGFNLANAAREAG